jgi:hypothetical protein
MEHTSMTHTIDTLMALIDEAIVTAAMADKIKEFPLTKDTLLNNVVAKRDALHAALVEALAKPVREPLTDKQISKLWSDAHNDTSDLMAFQVLAKLVERAHHIGGDK